VSTLAIAVLCQIISDLLWRAGYVLPSHIALGIAAWFAMIYLFIKMVEGINIEQRVERWLERRKKRRYTNGRPPAPQREYDPRD
jgi:hypothetical protein